MTSRSEIKSSLSSVLDISLLKDALFVFYCLSAAFGVVARISVSFYLVRYAQDINIANDYATYMLSVSQITNVVICLFMGFVTSSNSTKKSPDGNVLISHIMLKNNKSVMCPN